jgi:hypothetical protein
LTEVTPEALDKFVQKVKELLESMTGKPYGISEKQHLEGSIWRVYIDREKLGLSERLSLNRGAKGVEEEKDGAIKVYSDNLSHINDWADEYDFYFDDFYVLLDRNNWEKYRGEVPRLIALLEAAESIADELNRKYGTKITLWSGDKPYLETIFDAKGMSEGEKLQEIEKGVRAMLKAWERVDEWIETIGAEMAKKTERSRMRIVKFRKDVISRLQDITKSEYTTGYKKALQSDALWSVVGWCEDKKDFGSNRGVWYVKETKEGITIFSDNFETINARNELEYNSIKLMGGITAGDLEARLKSAFTFHHEVDEHGWNVARPITQQEAMKYGKKTIVSPQLLESVAEQVSREFGVEVRVMKDKPVLVTEFKTKGLKQNDKLYEIERRAKALAEAWQRIKELAKEAEDTKA